MSVQLMKQLLVSIPYESCSSGVKAHTLGHGTESESFMFSLPSMSSHDMKQGHLFSELASCPFCPD